MDRINTRTMFLRVIEADDSTCKSCMRVHVDIEHVGILGHPPDPLQLAAALKGIESVLPGRPATEADLREPERPLRGGYGASVPTSEGAFSMDELRKVQQAINRAGHEGAVEGSPEAATTAGVR